MSLPRSLLRLRAPLLVRPVAAPVPSARRTLFGFGKKSSDASPPAEQQPQEKEASSSAFPTPTPETIKEAAEKIQGSATLKAFLQDPEVKAVTQRMQALLQSKGYSATNPPGMLAMGRLVADSEFRQLLTDMQQITSKHNLHPDELKALGKDLTGGFIGGGSKKE